MRASSQAICALNDALLNKCSTKIRWMLCFDTAADAGQGSNLKWLFFNFRKKREFAKIRKFSKIFIFAQIFAKKSYLFAFAKMFAIKCQQKSVNYCKPFLFKFSRKLLLFPFKITTLLCAKLSQK